MFALHQDIVRRRKEEAKRRHEVHRKLAAQGIVGRTRHEDPEEGRRLDEQLRKVCRGELAVALADGVGEGLSGWRRADVADGQGGGRNPSADGPGSGAAAQVDSGTVDCGGVLRSPSWLTSYESAPGQRHIYEVVDQLGATRHEP